jgi:hypothetical protein
MRVRDPLGSDVATSKLASPNNHVDAIGIPMTSALARKVFSVLLGAVVVLIVSIFALAVVLRATVVVAVFLVIPGTVYVPVRLLLLARPLPKDEPAVKLFLAWMRGLFYAVVAFMPPGLFNLALGLLDTARLISREAFQRIYIPFELLVILAGIAFIVGAAHAAILDVREERQSHAQ